MGDPQAHTETAGEQQRSSSGRKPSRLSINMSRATEGALLKLMDDKDVSMTKAVRRLVGYGTVVYRAMRDDREVLIRSNGQTERVCFSTEPGNRAPRAGARGRRLEERSGL